MDQRFIIRVVINKDDIRKLTLNERPDSIEELKTELKDKMSLQYDFRLQYEDPDFNNALCNLSEITDLPDRATLRVILLELTPLSPATQQSDCSTADTEILSTAESSPPLRKQWPEFFDIPNFSVDVEYRLRQADLKYMSDRLPITPSRDIKHP